MVTTNPLLTVMLVLIAAGLMAQVGVFKKKLRWRNRRICEQCGREMDGCTCRRERHWGVGPPLA